MSYILEALKKDEANSDPKAAAAWALAAAKPDRPWLLWLVIAALVVNAGVLGYLFYPRADPLQRDAERLGRSAPAVTQPGASRELPVSPRRRVAPPGQAAPAAAANRRAPAPAEIMIQPQATTARAAVPPDRPAAPAGTVPGAGRVLTPEQAAAMDLLPAEPAPAAGELAAQARPGEIVIGPGAAPPPKVQTSTPTAAKAAATPDRRTQIIQLAELPPKDRQDFPRLEFSTHIFADDPALRAVVVNTKRLNEGESIGEMVLRAVTEDGILVDYRGYRVAVSVIEDWKDP